MAAVQSEAAKPKIGGGGGGGGGRARVCSVCNQRRAALKRPKTLQQICRDCFYAIFEEEVHNAIVENQLFNPGERIAIGASGGKDSTVLAYVLSELNRRHNYGLDLFLLSVDEGITGYRDDSLETVKRNEIQYGLPLKVVSYKDLYGWTMDEIVKMIGLKNNCTFCGVFRRQALDRGAAMLKVDKLVTGHNADDIAETVLLNILRGDIARLSRCTSIITGEDGPIPRCKPFKYTYEKEIVIYPFAEGHLCSNTYLSWKTLTTFSRMHISRGWITFQLNAFTLLMHIGVLPGSSLRILKGSDLEPYLTSSNQGRISGYPHPQRCQSREPVSAVGTYLARNGARRVFCWRG